MTREKLSEQMANQMKLSLFLQGGPCSQLLAVFQLKSCESSLNKTSPKISPLAADKSSISSGILLAFCWISTDRLKMGTVCGLSADVNCFILPDVWDKIMH